MSPLRTPPGGAGGLRDRSAATGPGWPAAGARPVDTFRSSSARLLAVIWWALSLVALVDLAAGGRDHLAAVIVAGVLLSDVLVWVGAWRPGVVLYPEHVVLRGSLRDRVVALAEVTDARSVGPLAITAGGRTFTSAAVSSTVRERRRAGRESAAVPPSFGGGGLGRGGRSSAMSVGFDDSRMDAATRDAVVGRTAGSHAAERIAEEARRLRRAERAAGTADAPRDRVSAARWLPVPVAAVVVLLAVFVAVASS